MVYLHAFLGVKNRLEREYFFLSLKKVEGLLCFYQVLSRNMLCKTGITLSDSHDLKRETANNGSQPVLNKLLR